MWRSSERLVGGCKLVKFLKGEEQDFVGNSNGGISEIVREPEWYGESESSGDYAGSGLMTQF